MKKLNLQYAVVLWIVVLCLPILAATAVSGWPIKGTDGYYRTFTVGDVLSSSPGKEAMAITTSDKLIIYSRTGSKLKEFTVDVGYQTPTLADFNNDGLLEIVVAPYNELHRIEDGIESTIYTGNGSVVYRPVVVEDLNRTYNNDINKATANKPIKPAIMNPNVLEYPAGVI